MAEVLAGSGRRLDIISVIGSDYTSTACSPPSPNSTSNSSDCTVLYCTKSTMYIVHWTLLRRIHCTVRAGGLVMPLASCPSSIFWSAAWLHKLSAEMPQIDRNDQIDGIEKIEGIELILGRGRQHSVNNPQNKSQVKRQRLIGRVQHWSEKCFVFAVWRANKFYFGLVWFGFTISFNKGKVL